MPCNEKSNTQTILNSEEFHGCAAVTTMIRTGSSKGRRQNIKSSDLRAHIQIKRGLELRPPAQQQEQVCLLKTAKGSQSEPVL